jgi:multisubunit Na+/H+ antiporter MnhB subunit
MFQSFSPGLWIVVGFTVALLAVSLASISFMIRRHGLHGGADYSLTNCIFIVVGAYCQKGNIAKR